MVIFNYAFKESVLSSPGDISGGAGALQVDPSVATCRPPSMVDVSSMSAA